MNSSQKNPIQDLWDHLDNGTIVVIVITLILFVIALFTKGFTHDLLLEAGVFLISVKLVLMVYNNKKDIESIHDKLDILLRKIDEQKGKSE